MNFTKYICPVCAQAFKEDDDVVVCPDCGMPHHRTCWFENGKCFYHEKHGVEEIIKKEISQETIILPVEEDKKDDLNGENGQPQNEAQEAVKEIIEEIRNNTTDNVKLDGNAVSCYEAALGKNQKYYIPRFMLMEKVKKALSWNSAAFFVPLAWSLYRKMYKLSALIFAVYMLIFGSISFSILGNEELVNSINTCVQEDPNFAEKILAYESQASDVSLTASQKELYNIMTEISIPVWQTVLFYIINIGVRMAMGLFSSNMYFKKLSKNIKAASLKGFDDNMLKTYLFKKYGTFPMFLAVIVGFLELQIFWGI